MKTPEELEIEVRNWHALEMGYADFHQIQMTDREDKDKTKAEFCNELGVSMPTLRAYTDNIGKMLLTIAIRFCEITTADIDDLFKIFKEQRK